MQETKVKLWYSKRKAADGKVFYVPTKDGKEMIKCTGITLDDKKPSDSSEFLTEESLMIPDNDSDGKFPDDDDDPIIEWEDEVEEEEGY